MAGTERVILSAGLVGVSDYGIGGYMAWINAFAIFSVPIDSLHPMKYVLLFAAQALFLTAGLNAQTTAADGQRQFVAGADAWDKGNYVEAIDLFDDALASGDAEVLRSIALVTGEFYVTTEVAPDGTNPAWAADGRSFSFQTSSDGIASTHVFAVTDTGAERVTDVTSGSVSISTDGSSVAYLRLNAGDELDAARTSVREGVEVRSRAQFLQLQRELAAVDATFSDLVVRDLASGDDRVIPDDGRALFGVSHHPANGELLVLASGSQADSRRDVHWIDAGEWRPFFAPSASMTSLPRLTPDGAFAVYSGEDSIFVHAFESEATNVVAGESPTMSADGSAIAFVSESGGVNQVRVMTLGGETVTAYETSAAIDNPALSPNGDRVVFQLMGRENWELMVATSDGSSSNRLTYEVQHDLFPRFVTDDTILGIIGEGRHRRSHLYDADTGARTRLFHNNSVRTVAPEYEWSVSPDGRYVLIVSERDGDTISPERAVYLVDLHRTVSSDEVMTRLDAMRESEVQLADIGKQLFSPIAGRVRDVVSRVSTGRIYGYEKDLFRFGSKFITQPGNAEAIEYLAARLREFGYEPELQWFEPRGLRSANVIATLEGTGDPDVIYVISSHFDSVERGPGADDNTSGTAALLEAARVMRDHPQHATIKLAFFTGEEAGLLGSREFVRRAVEAGDKIVGALNNDMVGYANDHRLDNTIRYSNDGIRDIQHNAASMFTDLITYDARYYKSTDAHAYYDAYGDIVGGIGSYPILGSPHYHQEHDVLETVNHQLIAEVSKTTVATIMLLASSPSRLTGIEVTRDVASAAVAWEPAVESNVLGYRVTFRVPGQEASSTETVSTSVPIPSGAAGTELEVRALNDRGMVSWDAARARIDD